MARCIEEREGSVCWLTQKEPFLAGGRVEAHFSIGEFNPVFGACPVENT